MDIYVTYFPLQIVITLFCFVFLFLAYEKPAQTALLFPALLPFYLVKLFVHPQSLFNFSSYFTPPYSETPVIRPDSFSIIPINLLEILIVLFLIVNLSTIFRSIKSFLETSLGKYFLTSIAILLISVLISTVYAMNLRVALGAAKSWLFLPILLFFSIVPYLKSPEFRQKFLYSWLISGGIICVGSVVFLIENTLTYDGRLAGIFLSPNHLSMALVPGILAMLVLVFRKNQEFTFSLFKNVNYRIWSVALFLLLALTLTYMTYSYGTWIGLFAASIFLLIISGPSGSKLKLKSVATSIIALVLLATTQLNNPKLAHILNGDYYSSLHSRIMIWNSALSISKDNWITGIGVDNFQQAYLDYAKNFTEPYIEWSAPQPHNIFLAFSTQLGLIGLLGFISILFLTLKISLAQKSQKPRSGKIPDSTSRSEAKEELAFQLKFDIKLWKFIKNWALRFRNLDPLSLWALAYLVYFLVHGLIDTPYFKNDLAIIFWLTLAALWSSRLNHTTGYESRDK